MYSSHVPFLKYTSIKAIYIHMHLKGLLIPFRKWYYILCYDLQFWDILLNFCGVSIFLNILIANISWTVGQTSINHIIFWKSIRRIFRCIYVNCCNILGKIGKNALFCLRTITQEGSMETRQMTPFFVYFFHSNCLWRSFLYLNSFLCGPSCVYSGL